MLRRIFHQIDTATIGTPRTITASTDNQVVWKWDNAEPFGNNAPNENPSGLGNFEYNLGFPGQYRDKETGTFYNFFRDYDPSTDRYIESDPIGLKGGINTYTYVDGNPVSYVDPLGLDATDWNNTKGGRSKWDGPTNGNWGGKCWSGGAYSCEGRPDGNAPPTDSGDACYMAHDKCYEQPACNTPDASKNKQAVKACDLQLVQCLQGLPNDSKKWPKPPRQGTEGDSERYRDAARRYFK